MKEASPIPQSHTVRYRILASIGSISRMKYPVCVPKPHGVASIWPHGGDSIGYAKKALDGKVSLPGAPIGDFSPIDRCRRAAWTRHLTGA